MKVFIAFLGIVGAALTIAHFAFAQTANAPEIILSWESLIESSSPYIKNLPSRGATVKLAVAVLRSSQMVDLSGYEIRWRLNRNVLESGQGLARTSFVSDQNSSRYLYDVEVVIKNFSNAGDLRKTITVPFYHP